MTEPICLAWLTGGQTEGGFTRSVADVLFADGQHAEPILCRPDGAYMTILSGPRVAEGRTQMADQFLRETTAQILVSVDDDMTFSYDDLRTLVSVVDAEKRPIVGGLCFSGGSGTRIRPVISKLEKVGGMVRPEPVEDYPRDALVKVGATGAAFLAVHRSVFERMAAPWPEGFGTRQDGMRNAYPWFIEGCQDADGVPYGEDVAFMVRAQSLGIPVHVHTGVKIGHVKTQTLTEALWDAQQRAEVAAGGG